MTPPAHHIVDSKFVLTNKIKQKIGTVYFYNETIIVVEFNEGFKVTFSECDILLFKGFKIIKNKPWVYISNRINSYSVVPIDYKYINRINKLKGFCIVSPENAINSHQVEKMFCKKPFSTWTDLNSAMIWAEKKLSYEENNKKKQA